MIMKFQLLAVSLVVGAVARAQPTKLSDTSTDLTQYINFFIGTQGPVADTSFNGGNVFPGPTLPFGAAKPGIDTTEFNGSTDANAGYTPDGNVTAFTMLHESGTGGAPKYGVIPQMPLTSLDGVNVLDNLTYMQPRTTNDSASIGYYRTSLVNGIVAEFSASQHSALFRYNYPQSGQRLVLVDLSHYLPTQDEVAGEQMWSNGRLDVDGQKYSGYAIYRGGWNEAPDWKVYFCAQFDSTPSSARLFRGPHTDPYPPNETHAQPTFVNGTSIVAGTDGWDYADRIGAIFEFDSSAAAVQSKVGVSWISTDKACGFLDEIPEYDVNATASAAKDVWNQQVMNKIQVDGQDNDTRLEMFYSAMYRAHLLPSNRTGENPNWTPTGDAFDDLYTLWDTFRCLNSLYTLIQPEVEIGIVQTLIDIWRYEGFMPDGRSSNYNGRTQGGSNADNVLADAYIKGLGGDRINWTDAYAAMVKDAEVTPPNNLDYEDSTGSTKEGRGALPDWLEYGYVTPAFGRCVSKTVEYSLNDFALSQVAKDLAPQDYNKYLNRSAGWQHIWKADEQSLNFTGFLAPTYGNGSIQAYDPLSCGACEWNAIAYEALPWEYSWTVPFDMQTLIAFMGGPNTTESRLDTMFIPGLRTGGVGGGGNNGIGSTLFNPGNEPSFATPFLYNYLQGKQSKSVQRSRETVNAFYSTEPNGLPGNSDAGAVDSWLIWNMVGLYPVVTQDVYLILSPWSPNVTMDLGDGKKLQVTATGLGEDSYYVQSLTVNGKNWTQSWLTHQDLVGGNGGTLEFVLGSEPQAWDTGALPPSPGHVSLNGTGNGTVT